MLKMRNHADGFADSMTGADIDGVLLTLNTPRTANLTAGYTIESHATQHTFSGIAPGEHLIVPLFVGTDELLSANGNSRDPRINDQKEKTQGLTVTGIEMFGWTIVGMKGGESTGLVGSGNILSGSNGVIRHRASQCYDKDVTPTPCGSSSVIDEIPYFWDEAKSVVKFLNEESDEAYILIYNDGETDANITFQSNTPFALPKYRIEAFARNGDALQIFAFEEDRSKYYDALKYGAYNTGDE